MQIEFRLPSLGADMEGAQLTQWLKKPGEAVRRGEPLATVETAKGLIDIESYEDGTLVDLIVQPGTNVPVGTVLAHLAVEGATPGAAVVTPSAPTHAPVTPAAPAAARPAPSSAPPGPLPAPPSGAPPPALTLLPSAAPAARISPAARRRAEELGIALETLQAAGGGRTIHIEDVERLARTHAAAAPIDARAAMRAAIGAAMARSKREIPHYYLSQSLDFGPAQAWLAQYNATRAVKDRLIDAVLITKAVAVAAARLEGFSGHVLEERFRPARPVHTGVAIAVRGGGLVAPALLEADRKELATLMQEFSELVSRVRAGHMRSGEFTAATITVNCLGADGADLIYPIINPPQVAIVGTGAIQDRPWVEQGQLVIRPVLTLALAADHRVTDGRVGSRFLKSIAELLAKPACL